ncbi:MAG: META domain-containing protein [Chromatiales bacterium]|jgi:heat shock protein HslJ|nr:META domain-containing protein [Chromatiales bacterium]
MLSCPRWLALATTALLAACSTLPPAAEAPALDGTAWVLAALPGRALVPDVDVTLAFGDGAASGTDGCNRFSAPYTSGSSRLDISPKGASTMMACPPRVMEQASAYLASLARAANWRVAAGQLELLSPDGILLASFAPQATQLAGTRWRVTAVNNGRQAVVGVVTGSTLTMAFGADGRVTGSAGCNSYTAAWSQQGDRLSLGPPAATRLPCAEVAVMEQEQLFLRALGTVAIARQEASRLELSTAGGAMAVTLVREASP